MSDPHPDHADDTDVRARADAGDGHGLGRHLLGPHVVGQRVVIRRVIPGETGPSGGPALTDVLGVCETWPTGEDPLVRVRREDGTVVSFPASVIVSGKPVPPRASVRMRVTPREAELHGVRSWWPPLQVADLGDWVLRSEPAPVGRLLKRANSCLAIGDPGCAFAEAEAGVRAFYAERDRPALVQVSSATDGAADSADALWLAAGWTDLGFGASLFQIASVAHLRRSLPRGDADVTLESFGDDRAVARVAGDVAGGQASLDGDWLGVTSVRVDPAHRRRGWGSRVLAALTTWGAERGASTVWLHVETDNAVALAWYAALGFRTHHSNRYLLAPGATWPTSS